MKPDLRDLPVAALGLLVLASAFVVWRQHETIRSLRAQTHTITLTTRAVPSPDDWSAHVTALAHPDLPGDPMESSATPHGYATADYLELPVTTGGGADVESRFLQHLTLHQHARLDEAFAALFRELNLTPGELARFKQLLVDKFNVDLDVLAYVKRTPSARITTDEASRAVRQARHEIDAAIRATLGDERFETFQDYEQSLPARIIVARLQTRLSYTDDPLQPAQAEALVTALRDTPTPTLNPKSRPAPLAPTDGVPPPAVSANPANTLTRVDEAPLLAAARPVLTAAQLNAFSQVAREESAGAALREFAAASVLYSGATSTAPSHALTSLDIASFVLLQ